VSLFNGYQETFLINIDAKTAKNSVPRTNTNNYNGGTSQTLPTGESFSFNSIFIDKKAYFDSFIDLN